MCAQDNDFISKFTGSRNFADDIGRHRLRQIPGAGIQLKRYGFARPDCVGENVGVGICQRDARDRAGNVIRSHVSRVCDTMRRCAGGSNDGR